MVASLVLEETTADEGVGYPTLPPQKVVWSAAK